MAYKSGYMGVRGYAGGQNMGCLGGAGGGYRNEGYASSAPDPEASGEGFDLMSSRNLKFIKVGLPFFSIIVGGAYGLHFFQQVRYDFRKIKQEDTNLNSLKTDLSVNGLQIRDNVTVDSVYQEIAELDTDNWENIRGPRDTEDLTQYEKIKGPRREVPEPQFPDPRLFPLGGQPQLAVLDPPEPDDNASVRAERGSPTSEFAGSFHVENERQTPPSVSVVGSGCGDEYPEVPVPFPSRASPSEIASSSTVLEGNVFPDAPQDPIDPQAQQPVNKELLARLFELGFDDFTSELALIRTHNQGVEQAINWILDHSNPSDFESGTDSEEEEQEEEEEKMGATQSAAPATASGAEPATGSQNMLTALMSARKAARTHKMVLVANMSLKMGVGKLAAQVGHATLAVYRQAISTESGQEAIDSWTRHGQVKVVVRGTDTEHLLDLFKTAKDAGCFAYVVQDAGYTQIPAGSRTVLGVFGEKDQVDLVTGKLKLL